MKLRIADCGLRIGWWIASVLQLLVWYPFFKTVFATEAVVETLRVVAKSPAENDALNLMELLVVCSNVIWAVLAVLAIIGLAKLKRAIDRRLDALRRTSAQSAIRNPQSAIAPPP